MPDSALHALLSPRSMAVIGASSDPKRMSGMIIAQARALGFTGEIYPVNPRYAELAGFRCYASVLELADTPPDVAVIYLKAEQALAAVEECIRIGVRSLIVLSAGFAEVGPEGKDRQRRLVELCRGARMAVCGPNTAGLANFNAGFVAYGASGFEGIEALGGGQVAIISSSGGLGTTLLSYCRQRGLGVSHLIGIGNEAVTTAGDYLDSLVDDEKVRCIIALLESIRDAETFFAAADRALSAGKTVVVMKQGRSAAGQRSIQTHTAAMGGSAADFEAACRAHGIIVVRELRALADQAMLAINLSTPAHYDVGVLSLPGGGTSLLADAASEHGFVLPPLSPETEEALRPMPPEIASVCNPLDPTAGFGRDTKRLQSTIETFASDPNFGVSFFFQSTSEASYCASIASAIVAARDRISIPLLVVWESGPGLEDGAWRILREAGVPLFVSAMDAFAALRRYRWHAERAAIAQAAGEPDFGPLASEGFNAFAKDCVMDPEVLLDQIGVRRPAAAVVTDIDEAVAVADRIGYPVVLKLHSERIAHKTDIGGVKLGIKDADAVRIAYGEIIEAVTRSVGGDAIDGVLVQETVPPGVEMIVSVHVDEQIGPLVTIGYGGITTELFQDITRRPAPLTRNDVREMIGELRIAPLLEGYRGRPAASVDAFVDLVTRIGWAASVLGRDCPSIELNPVIVGPEGTTPLAVDWLVL